MIVVGGWPGRNVVGLNGAFGVRPAAFSTGGPFPNPLANDVDAGDSTTEFVLVVSALPGSGTVTLDDNGGFSHAGAADGSYTTTATLYTWAQGGPITQHVTPESISSVIGAAISFTVAPVGLASTLAYGAPSFARYVDFAVAATGLASAAAFGSASFSALREFSLAPAGLPSGAAYGSASLAFQVPDPGEPVTVDEAKQAARFDGDELDAFISGVISAARAQAEQITGRVYRRRVFSFELPSWPAPGHRFTVHEPDACEISYWGASGWQQLSGAAFEFDGVGSGAAIAPALGSDWPALAAKALGARVRVDFTAGPTDSAQVDETVKLYIKAQVAAWLNSPEAMADKDLQASPLIARLLDAERLWC